MSECKVKRCNRKDIYYNGWCYGHALVMNVSPYVLEKSKHD